LSVIRAGAADPRGFAAPLFVSPVVYGPGRIRATRPRRQLRDAVGADRSVLIDVVDVRGFVGFGRERG